MQKTKKIIFIAILVATAVILSIVDRFITMVAFPTLPQAKIGLANIVVLFAVYNFTWKESLILVFLKSLIANLIFGQLTSFIIGGTATLVSYAIMMIMVRYTKNLFSMMGVSVAGGFTHIIVQLAIISVIYLEGNQNVVALYGIGLSLLGVATSFLVGLLVYKMNPRLQDIMKTLG
ncbi:MAG: Gx transporter family protein [Bacilli bacterium]|nr:Gx transporter family protein [Bacilli bacterium]